MLKIRMQRTGRINQPSYRIVVVEHTASPKAGKFVERLGSYNPHSKERVLDEDRVKYWLSVGAQPSGTVHNMLVTLGILSGKKVNVLPKKHPPVKEASAEETPVAEAPAPAPAAAEVPKEEVKEEKKEEAPAESTEAPAEKA